MGLVRLRSTLLAATLIAPAALAGAGQAPASDAVQEAAARPERDAEAVTALEDMGKALRALKQYTLQADTSTDYVADSGQKLALDGTVAYTVRMPDHFAVDVHNDQQHRQFFYDGKALTIWSPRLKYYAVVEDVPPTIAGLVRKAADDGIEFPLADLFLWGTDQAPVEQVRSAFLVGPSMVDGKAADHYAYRQEGVDWQVWIARDSHLPAKVVITSLADPVQPAYTARLHWDMRARVGNDDFAFKPPADARRLEFVPLRAAAGATDEEQ